jgi:hypothetical protein
MKIQIPFVSVCLIALPFQAGADTFILNDGSKIEGSILSENETSYVLEVRITKSIKDERVVAKSDVAKIQREKPDLIAFEPIAALIPIPDSLTAEQYAGRIRMIEKFLSEHRGSSKTKEARKILATHKAEANEILAGAIKLNGKIVPPAEYRANAYEIDARIEETKIRELIKNARYLEALRTFSEFDRDFRNTEARSAVLPLINQVMNTHLTEVGQLLATYDARAKERASGLERMSPADRRSTEIAIAEEKTALESRLKAEKDAKIGWVTPHPFYKPSLDDTVNFGKQEIGRLSISTSAPVVDGGKTFRDALQKIQSGADKAAATAAISAAKSAMVAPKYIAILEAAAANR